VSMDKLCPCSPLHFTHAQKLDVCRFSRGLFVVQRFFRVSIAPTRSVLEDDRLTPGSEALRWREAAVLSLDILRL